MARKKENSMNELMRFNSDTSPFDAIRQIGEDGAEYWSARDLMPLLGYDQWRRFADAIERAKASAAAQGHGTEGFLPAPAKTSEAGGRPRQDFLLSRYAAHRRMSGDSRLSLDKLDVISAWLQVPIESLTTIPSHIANEKPAA